jgi:hypothetical protein
MRLRNSDVRPTAADVIRCPHFDNVPVMTCRFLDKIYEKEDVAKAQFMKSLPQVLPSMPKPILLYRVSCGLPLLMQTCSAALVIHTLHACMDHSIMPCYL